MHLTKQLIRETKTIIQLYLFLRYDCGVKFVDKLSAKQLKELFYAIKDRKKGLNDTRKVV